MNALKNTLLAAVVSATVALLTIIALHWFGIGAKFLPNITALGEGLPEDPLEKINLDLAELHGENKLLKSIIANMIEDNFPSSAENTRIALQQMPDKYISQVLEFFSSPESLNLIATRPTSGGVWYFTKPLFISPDLFFINYTNDVDTETLLIRLEFLTASDFQYNVLWSSLEY
ncbi:MAG: hypothetical protein JSU92_11560 [Deltaproteobacteria bacterium]|nr:MAG: hypothetical protein JSU92_11560 [Deltaproteobacteria bacterium]